MYLAGRSVAQLRTTVEVPGNRLLCWCGSSTWKECDDRKAQLSVFRRMLNNVTDTENILIRE